MSRFPKPREGSWTEHYPELRTGLVSYEDSVAPEFFELEREAVFMRAWLNVARVEQLTYSLIMVSLAVEVWRQPRVIDAGTAYFDRCEEPVP